MAVVTRAEFLALEARVLTMDVGLKEHAAETRAFITEAIEGVESRLGARIDAVVEQVRALEARFDRLDQRLKGVETRLDGFERRFEGVETRLDGLERRFEGVETRLDGLERRFEGVETRLGALEARFGTFDRRVSRRLDEVLRRLPSPVSRRTRARRIARRRRR